MSEILQLTQLVEHHGVSDMNVRSGGIKPQFAAQRLSGCTGSRKLLLQLAFDKQSIGAAADRCHGLPYLGRHLVFLFLLLNLLGHCLLNSSESFIAKRYIEALLPRESGDFTGLARKAIDFHRGRMSTAAAKSDCAAFRPFKKKISPACLNC